MRAPRMGLSREYASVSVCHYGETSGGQAECTVWLAGQYSDAAGTEGAADATDRAIHSPRREIPTLSPGLSTSGSRSSRRAVRAHRRLGGGGCRLGNWGAQRAVAPARGATDAPR